MKIVITILTLALFISCKEQDGSSVKKPDRLDDGILTASLKVAEMDEAIIKSMQDSVTAGVYQNIHSILIFRNNKLVYENYFPGNDEVRMKGFVGFVEHHPDSLHDIRSISKSVTSAAVMIAVAQGKIKTVNQRLFDFFPEFAKYDTGMKRQITIKHLLNMSAGLYWGEDLSYNDSLKKGTVSDAFDFILLQPMRDTPGRKFEYSSSYTQLLAEIIERATGMNIEKFTARFLFQPLGISNYEWTLERNGLISAWAGLRMRSRDLLKFGMLYLNGGIWKGKQIIPLHLVEQSLMSQISTPYGDSILYAGYGDQFWIYTETIKGSQVTYAQAQGNGGQIVVIDKQSNLVLVLTAGNYDQTNLWKSSWDIYADFIYPAIMK